MFNILKKSKSEIKKAYHMPNSSASWQKLLKKLTLLFLFLLCSWLTADADNKTLVSFQADKMEPDTIDGEPCKKLIGNTLFTFEDITIQADTAIYHEEKELIEAIGNVKIIDKDGVTILADRLIYDQKSQLAQLRDQVIYTSGATTFYTDYLDYHTETHKGHFMGGGTLVEGENMLTSDSGYYDDIEKSAIFYQNVEMVNKEYTLQCNTLHYNTVTKIAQFKGPTKIINSDGKRTLTTDEGGEYDTSNQYSSFAQSTIETQDFILYGDLIRADQAEEVYTATGNVALVFKEDDVTISGDYGVYKKKEGTAQVYGNTLMTKFLGEEAVYLSADTFVATEHKGKDGHTDTVIKAYNNVKLYKEDFQGKADSMVYQGAESSIYFYGDPTFWSNDNQLSADTVRVLLKDKAFHEMYMNVNAFVISEDPLGNYNREMVAHFQENKIDYITIDGNAESLYFVIHEEKLQGVNHLQCSSMRINLEEEDISKITFDLKPVGTFYPPQLIKDEYKKLSNFSWKPSERPSKQDVVEHGYGKHQEYKEFKFNKAP
jgi:lipopolysaccharide export system protein LptA